MPDIPEDPTQSEWLVLDLLDELNNLFDKAKKDLVKIIDPGETKTSTKPLLQQQLDKVDNIFKTVNLNGKDIIGPHMSQSYEHGQMYAAIRLGHSEDDIQRATWKKVGGHVIEAQSNFKGLTDDVAKNVRRVIADGITNERTVKQISKDIRDQVDTIGKTRADMIARTETMKAVNVGVKDKYRSAGIEVVRWLATIQPGRTCEECKALNGKLFPIDKTPPIPKHPRCRCTLSPVPDPDWSEVEGWDGEKVTPPKEKKKGAKVSDEWNKRVDKEQRSKIDQEVLEKYGSFDPEDINDYKNKVNKKLKDAVDNSDVKVRIHNKTLEKVFESGRIKTQFESGTSSGIQNREMRLEFENKYFGYPRDTPDIERPIYGYLTPKGTTPEKDVSTLSQYGDIVVKLKDSERGRVTFNLGDSIDQTRGGGLNPITRPVLAPSKLSDPNIRSISLELFDPAKITKTNRIKDRMGKIRYVEAHIHGGIRLSDIAEIKIQPHKYADKVLEKYRRMAEEYGIKISIG